MEPGKDESEMLILDPDGKLEETVDENEDIPMAGEADFNFTCPEMDYDEEAYVFLHAQFLHGFQGASEEPSQAETSISRTWRLS